MPASILDLPGGHCYLKDRRGNGGIDFAKAALPRSEPPCLTETYRSFWASPVVRALPLLQDGSHWPRTLGGQVYSSQGQWFCILQKYGAPGLLGDACLPGDGLFKKAPRISWMTNGSHALHLSTRSHCLATCRTHASMLASLDLRGWPGSS